VTLGIYSQVIGDSQRRAVEKEPGFWTILDYKPHRGPNQFNHLDGAGDGNEPNLSLE